MATATVANVVSPPDGLPLGPAPVGRPLQNAITNQDGMRITLATVAITQFPDVVAKIMFPLFECLNLLGEIRVPQMFKL